ncbi:MAG: hypothetical protein BroJett041_04670 [Candidatus Jettenia caeni]|nr:MAG: hypothetical protein BroJett041_04670 [Candidatus Jettenia caeni]
MSIVIEEAKLEEIIRRVVREELLNLTINLILYVSDEEMKELENVFSEEDFKDGETVDGMRWLGQ